MPEWVWLAALPIASAVAILAHAAQRWQRARPAKHGQRIEMRRCAQCGAKVQTGLAMLAHFDAKHPEERRQA